MELRLPLLKVGQPPEGIRLAREIQIFTATMDTMDTPLDLAMRLERPTMFSGIRSHTTATGLGTAGDGKCETLA